MYNLPPLGRHDPLTAFYRFQVKAVLTGYFQSEVWIHSNCSGLLYVYFCVFRGRIKSFVMISGECGCVSLAFLELQ